MGYCTDYFYYYHGERQSLSLVRDYICLTVTDDLRGDLSPLENLGAVTVVSENSAGIIFVKCLEATSYNRVLSFCASSAMVKTYSPVFVLEGYDFLLAGASRVMVTLKNKADSTILNETIQRYNYSINYVDPYDSLFYVIHTNRRDGVSAIKASQTLYETGLFRAVSPDFVSLTEDGELQVSTEEEEDPSDSWPFLDQWNFYYSADTTVDINAQQAWQITTGNSNIVVAVLDRGVELDHPALINNLTLGYDAITDTYPAGSPHDTTNVWQHGTKCTGVIVAQKVSIFGMRGLANGCKVMPICGLGGSNFTSCFIRAINFAKNNGASVISMSWWYPSNDNMEIALQNAIDNGRNGKGCVALASAGIIGDSMTYFPRCMADVIVVGATDKCGKRIGAHVCTTNSNCCSSNQGEQLDIMAPGCAIPTTKMNHQYHLGTCTSISTPQVSGVAALILSVNPNLTARQVRSIIEGTAQKIGGYNYTPSSNHPNGTWNIEMGHGLVDAGAAVTMAQSLLSVPDVYIKDTPNDNGIEPNHENVQVTDSPDIWITDDGGNTVTQLVGGQTYQVHVRVRSLVNTDFLSSSLSVYWSVSDANLLWNYHWTSLSPLCGVPRCGTIANNYTFFFTFLQSVKTLVFNWTAPLYNSMTCSVSPDPIALSFVAKINDGRITVGNNASNYPIEDFVRENNNVAMKKLSIIPSSIVPPFLLSPNPSHGFVTLSWDESVRSDGGWRMSLINPAGQIVRNTALDTRANSMQIDLQGLPVGSYTVVVTGNNGFQWNEELIVY